MYDDFNKSYSDQDTGNHGYPTTAPDVYRQMVQLLHAANVHVSTHAIGDRAIDWVVDTYDQVLKAKPTRGLRHGIIHANTPSDHAIDTFARLQREFDAGYPEAQATFLWWLGDNYAGNLGALRELALMWTADRVDEALEQYREAHGITGTWETRERVVVAITGAPGGDDVIRRAARMAMRTRGELLGVHVRPADGLAGPSVERLTELRRLLTENHEPRRQQLRLARRALRLTRSLVRSGTVTRLDEPDEHGRRYVLTVDLPEDFALNQPLARNSDFMRVRALSILVGESVQIVVVGRDDLELAPPPFECACDFPERLGGVAHDPGLGAAPLRVELPG